MDNPFQSPAVISFCPGFLGIERGLERTIGPVRVVAYVEIEAFIIANLVAGMEAGVLDPAPIWTDAKTFDASPFRGRIHGIIGGYPCPGESLAGLREGHLYKGFIWPAIRRAIAAARPLWCFFENVDDHLTGTYPLVQRSLRNMGYATEAGIFTAEEIGAPQERQRLFILAVTESLAGRLYQGSRRSGKAAGNFVGSSEELADANGADGQGSGTQPLEGGISKSCDDHRAKELGYAEFPAGQGPWQYDWEEPRTIKSSVGCTINGYNFREDLLRAYGNAVVEQSAALAFQTLLNKMIDGKR